MRGIILVLILLLTFPVFVSAQEMQSPNYRLEPGTFEMSTEEQNIPAQEVQPEAEKSLLTTEEQTLFKSRGYIFINDDFNNNTELSLSLSANTIEFSDLTSKPLQEKNVSYTITSNLNTRINLFLHKDTELAAPNGQIISNTICQHSFPCTDNLAQEWVDSYIYGIGYRIINNKRPIDFITDSYYRSLPKTNVSKKIISYNNLLTNLDGKIGFKINLEDNQKDSSYESVLTLLVLPSL